MLNFILQEIKFKTTAMGTILFVSVCFTNIPSQQKNYFPLSIGNEYQVWNGFRNYFGKIERDTIYSNGKLYYSLPGPIFDFGDTRVDSSGSIFTTIIPFTGSVGEPDEYKIYKADAHDGEFWPVAWNFGNPLIDTLYAKLLFTDTLIVFGKHRAIKSILLYENEGPPYIFWIAEEIGKIRDIYDDGTIVDLNYALIDGKKHGILVAVSNESLIDLDDFMVFQNYPNPFNPLTNIVYQIKESGLVQIKVYDILGTEIVTLVNEEKSEGRYTINFNASNLPSGVYIYIMRVNDYTSSKKMILLR